MPLRKLDDIAALLKAHLAGEAHAGFPQLSRTPSSGMIKFLDYFSALTGAERDSLLHTLGRIGAMRFFPPQLVREQMTEIAHTDPAFVRYREAMLSAPFSMGMRYQGLRMLKAMLSDPASLEMVAKTRAALDFTPRDDAPLTLVPDLEPDRLQPAKAPLVRKLIDKAFMKLFAAGKEKRAGGETGYTGQLDGATLTVWIDFAAMGLQLRYGVSIPDASKRIFVWHMPYEDLWGAGAGWDYLTDENAEPSVSLLCEYIAQVVRLRNGILALM